MCHTCRPFKTFQLITCLDYTHPLTFSASFSTFRQLVLQPSTFNAHLLDSSFDINSTSLLVLNRLAATAVGNPSLQELTLLAAARRSAASGGGGVPPHVAGIGIPSSAPGELHPAYRLNPYVEHLYSSLHSSPTTSLRGLSPLDPRGNIPIQLFRQQTFYANNCHLIIKITKYLKKLKISHFNRRVSIPFVPNRDFSSKNQQKLGEEYNTDLTTPMN